MVGEMLANDWHVMGCFMYPPEAPQRLAALVAWRQLDLSCLRIRRFSAPALEPASRMRGLDRPPRCRTLRRPAAGKQVYAPVNVKHSRVRLRR
jgi:hypothetical protein